MQFGEYLGDGVQCSGGGDLIPQSLGGGAIPRLCEHSIHGRGDGVGTRMSGTQIDASPGPSHPGRDLGFVRGVTGYHQGHTETEGILHTRNRRW